MRRVLICGGVLGLGTGLVFGAAALTAVLLPPSRIVPQVPGIMFGGAVPAKFAPAPLIPVDDGSRMRIGPSVDLPAPETVEGGGMLMSPEPAPPER